MLIIDNFLQLGIILWTITAIVAIVGSLVTEPIPESYLHRLTFW